LFNKVKLVPLVKALLPIVIATIGKAESAESSWETAMLAGKTAMNQRQFTKAHKFFKLASRLADNTTANKELTNSLYCQASVYDLELKFAQANKLTQKALALETIYYKSDSPLLATMLQIEGDRLLQHKDYKKAELIFRRLLPIREQLFQHRQELSDTLTGLAASLEAQHMFKDAESLYVRCLKIYFPKCQDLSIRLENLARCYMEQNKVDAAFPLFARIKELNENKIASTHAEEVYRQANICRVNGNFAQSEDLYARALTYLEKANNPQLAIEILRSFSRLLKSMGRVDQSIELNAKADKARDLYTEYSDKETGLILQ